MSNNKMEGENIEVEPYILSTQQIVEQLQKIDWTNIEESDLSSTPVNLHYQTQPPAKYIRFYKIFRGVLNTQEISERSYLLSTLILHLKTSNFYAMMLRSKFFISKQQNVEEIKRQLYFCSCILNSNPKEYQVWTYKKLIFDTFKDIVDTSQEIYQLQTSFLDFLLEQDSKNYHVWDYKFWLTLYFAKQIQQLEYTKQRLFNSIDLQQLKNSIESLNLQVQEQINWKNCYSLWSYRYHLRQKIIQSSSQADIIRMEQMQIQLMNKWFGQKQNISNQCAWNYFTGFILKSKFTKQQDITNFIQTTEIFFTENNNRFAGATLLQLYDQLELKYSQQVPKKRQTIQTLLKVDPVREQYYKYLLK